MVQHTPDYADRRHGGILLSVLACAVVISMILAGITTVAVSHYSRTRAESNYAAALCSAEAGVNYELRNISNDSTTADQKKSSGTPGTSYTTSAGTFQVYVTQLNQNGTETTPWSSSSSNWLYIYSTGIVNGISRTVRVGAKGVPPVNNYAIYAIKSGTLTGTSIAVTGSIGTNGSWSFSGHPPISGGVYFNGPTANWAGGTPSGYSVFYNPKPVLWSTVDQIANQMFPGDGVTKGLAWLATHNDNASLGLGTTLTDSVVFTPGNYYFTSVNVTGTKTIYFNNASGPINVWIGPSGGSGSCTFRGGSAAVAMSVNPNVHIYCATTGGVTMSGNQEVDCCIYAYTKDVLGNDIGSVTNSGTPTLAGMIVSNTVALNGNNWVFSPGLATPASVDYYGCTDSWQEINGAN